jgi:hypothetical protein
MTDEKYYQKYGRYKYPEGKWMILIIIILVVLLKIFNRI